MEAYFFSSETSLAPLFKVQFEALCLCTGAMRSPPTICLQHSCGETPLEIRHELLCLKYKAHLLTFLEHPTKTLICDSFQEHFPDSSTSCSFNLFTKRFTPNSVFNPNLIYTPHIPVWLVLNPQLDFAVYNFAHQNLSTNYVPFFLSHLNYVYDYHTYICTDGSKTANKAGWGVYIETLNILYSTQLNKFSSVFSTELYGMLQALYWISSNHIQKAVIITDSLSALRAIQHPNWKRHYTVNKIAQLNHSLLTSNNTITFLWTPAHSNIPGKETADQLPKISTSDLPISTALEIYRKQSTLPLSLPNMYALIKTSYFAVWNAKYTNSPKAAHYKQIFQTTENGTCGPRSCDSPILFRLQTGHNGRNFHLQRIGLHPWSMQRMPIPRNGHTISSTVSEIQLPMEQT